MRRLFYTLASVFAIILVVIVAITARNTVEVRKTNTTLESGDNVKLEKLVVSEVTHSVFYAPQYVAINLGFFKEEGLDIELINGGGADKVMTAVLSNQVDIGFAGPEAAVYIYNEGKEDFEEHNRVIDISNGEFKIKDTTRPYGFVDMNAKVWFQKFLDDGVNEHEYLMTEGYIWTGQYPESQRIIDKGNNQSMELSEDYLDATWTKDDNGKP